MWRARTGGGPGRGLERGHAESEGRGLVGRGPEPQWHGKRGLCTCVRDRLPVGQGVWGPKSEERGWSAAGPRPDRMTVSSSPEERLTASERRSRPRVPFSVAQAAEHVPGMDGAPGSISPARGGFERRSEPLRGRGRRFVLGSVLRCSLWSRCAHPPPGGAGGWVRGGVVAEGGSPAAKRCPLSRVCACLPCTSPLRTPQIQVAAALASTHVLSSCCWLGRIPGKPLPGRCGRRGDGPHPTSTKWLGECWEQPGWQPQPGRGAGGRQQSGKALHSKSRVSAERGASVGT